MRNKLFELNSFDEINVEGKNGIMLGRSRLLPIIYALKAAFGEKKVIRLGSPKTQRESFNAFLVAGRNLNPPFDRASGRFQRSLDILDLHTTADFVKFLADAQYNKELMDAEALRGIKVSFDTETRVHIHTGKIREDLYKLCDWTWDEDEALETTVPDNIWVVRTNMYPALPALFIYPKTDIDPADYELLISKYRHKLASIYEYELNDKSVNGYWLARPCKYSWFEEHPIPDGSEMDDVNDIDDDLSLAESYWLK